ncbi:signal-transducing adaptor protein 1 [Amia ocellicauda]|uniref:signal-transducing adaptor protein 1 n=1 Tax=Amia ocellicauda TaxID=2972642 RepID=UPI003463EFB9|nr:STAP1 protein [Amia calva]
MAAPIPAPRGVSKKRESITALPLYYEGFLHKKYTGEKNFKKFFAELRGSTLFLYSDDKNTVYSEKLELETLKAMVVDNTNTKSNTAVFTLTLQNEEVQLKIDNVDAAEEWRGFILTLAMLKIPTKLQLLPGQLYRLAEVNEMERERRATKPPARRVSEPCAAAAAAAVQHSVSETYDDVITDVPACFYNVSRSKAIEMLEEFPDYGNMILRPGSDNLNYAVTIRQLLPSGPTLKHYRVTSVDGGYAIALETPITVKSLNAVLEHFIKETNCYLRPYIMEQQYDTRIVMPLEKPPLLAKMGFSQKVVPQAKVSPMIHPRPPLLRSSQSSADDDFYLDIDCPEDKGCPDAFKKELTQKLQTRKERQEKAN